MSRSTRSVALSLLGLSMVLGVGAAPAFGGVLDYGAIANCRYEVAESGQYGWTEALLKKIAVYPPTMPRMASNQTVGWKFVLKRSLDRENTPWQVIYRSPLQRASKSSGFVPMRVAVKVPADSVTPSGQRFVWYHVTIKMFWYGPDGGVEKKISHPMGGMNLIVDGEEVLTDSYCPGRAEQFIDGA